MRWPPLVASRQRYRGGPQERSQRPPRRSWPPTPARPGCSPISTAPCRRSSTILPPPGRFPARADVLGRLADRLRMVAVVSGRPGALPGRAPRRAGADAARPVRAGAGGRRRHRAVRGRRRPLAGGRRRRGREGRGRAPARGVGRAQGPVHHPPLPPSSRPRGRGPPMGRGGGGRRRPPGASRPDVVRAAPVPSPRQGPRRRRAGRGPDPRLLPGRRPRRPGGVRRPRPSCRPAAPRRSGWRWPAPSRCPSCCGGPTSSSTVPKAPSTCCGSWPTGSRPADRPAVGGPIPRRRRWSWSSNQSRGTRAEASLRTAEAWASRSSGAMARAVARTSEVPTTSNGFSSRAAAPSSSHTPASRLRAITPLRRLTRAPSLATRFSPSRTGLTSRTS